MNYQIEINRMNVTLAQFLAEVRYKCKKNGINFDLDLKEFENPSRLYNSRYYVKDGIKICYNGDYRYEVDGSDAPAKSEVTRTLPYDSQIYILTFDGTMYNEIIEFTFDNEKRGHGYYFQKNQDITERPTVLGDLATCDCGL
jgi:hypothetical protein